MGLADIVRSWFATPTEKAYTGANWGDLWNRGQEYLLAPDQVVAPYTQVATVYTAITRISDAIAKIPMVLKQGEKPVEHPLLEVLENPSALLNGDQLLFATAQSLCTHGEAFWMPDRVATNLSSAGKEKYPRSIRLLRPSNMSHETDGGNLSGWQYTSTETGTINLRPDEVAFFRRHNPYHEIRGLGPMTAARVEYALEFKSGSWNEKFYDQGARPTGYIYSPPGQGSIPAAQRQDTQRALEEEFSGLRNAHRWIVLGNGKEIRPIALSQKDMDFLEGRRFSREQILAVFGVPPALGGVFEYANYANSQEQRRYFWANTIRPLACLIEATVQHAIIDRYLPGYEFELDVDAAVEKDIPEDYAQRIETALKLLNIGVPLAQLNEKFRLGFDTSDIPHAEISLVSGALRPAEQMLAPPEPVQGFPQRATKSLPRVTWRHFKRTLDGYESQMYRAIIPVLNRAESNVLALIPQVQSIRKDASDLIPADFTPEMQRALDPILVRILREAGESLLVELGKDIEFDAQDPRALAALLRRRVMIASSSDTMRRELRLALADAVAKAESWDRLREIVNEAFDGFRQNARTIARTEVNASFNSGRLEAMTQAGVRRHQWLTAEDDFVRLSHQQLDGAIARLGTNEWDLNGERVLTPLKYPHDESAPAGEVINCRCVTVALPED